MEKVKSKINTIQDRLESLKNNLESTSDLAEIDLLLEKIVASSLFKNFPSREIPSNKRVFDTQEDFLKKSKKKKTSQSFEIFEQLEINTNIKDKTKLWLTTTVFHLIGFFQSKIVKLFD